MNRVEKFRQYRRIKLKIFSVFFLFLLLIFTGISVADYSVNSIMRNEKRIGVLSFKEVDNNYLQINIMNRIYHVNIRYIKRDYNRLMELIR